MVLESLKRKINTLKSNESNFEDEEENVDQKIQQLKDKLGKGPATDQDFQQEINYFLQEAKESEQIADAIFESESEVLQLDEKITSGDYDSLTSDKIQEIIAINEEEEKVVEEFKQEVQHLQKQLDVLENLLSKHGARSNHSAAEGGNISQLPEGLTGKVEQAETILNDVENKLSEMEDGEEDMEMGRRKVLKMTGAAATAGAGAALSSSNGGNISRKTLVGALPEKQEPNRNSQATSDVKKSSVYRSETEGWSEEKQIKAIRQTEDINWSNGRRKEIQGLNFSAEMRQPSYYNSKIKGMQWDAPYLDDVALEYKVKNNSNQTLNVYLVATVPSGWAYYGAMNITQSAAGIISTNFILEPGESDKLVIFLYYNDGNNRNVNLIADYKIQGEKNSEYATDEKTITLPTFKTES